MNKAIVVVLTLAGFIALVLGMMGILMGGNAGALPWMMAILGLLFFTSGAGLIRRHS